MVRERSGVLFAIIHNQVPSGSEAARRRAEMGIIAETQPYHTLDDMSWMEERIGDRSRWANAFKTPEAARGLEGREGGHDCGGRNDRVRATEDTTHP